MGKWLQLKISQRKHFSSNRIGLPRDQLNLYPRRLRRTRRVLPYDQSLLLVGGGVQEEIESGGDPRVEGGENEGQVEYLIGELVLGEA